jgi:hypothetical protein
VQRAREGVDHLRLERSRQSVHLRRVEARAGRADALAGRPEVAQLRGQPGGEDGAEDRDADRSPDGAGERGGRRRHADVAARRVVLGDQDHDLHHQPDADAHDQHVERREHVGGAVVESRHQHQPGDHQRGACDRVGLVVLRSGDHPARDRGGDQGADHERQHPQPGHGRARAVHDLEVERQERDRAEHRHADHEAAGAGGRERARGEQLERQDRVGGPALAQDESAEGGERDGGQEVRVADRRGRQHGGGGEDREQQRAEHVHGPPLRARGGGQARADHQQRGGADGQVHVEDPAPRQRVDEEAAEQRPGDAGDREDAADHAHVAGALARWDEVGDDGHRGDDQAARPESLDGAEQDELEHRGGGARERRAGQEQHDRAHQDALAPDDVAELPVERCRDGLSDEVRRHDPGEVGEPAQLAGHGRERGGDDRLVERGQQDPERERQQDGDRRARGGAVLCRGRLAGCGGVGGCGGLVCGASHGLHHGSFHSISNQ